jgi:ABC-type sugar transport system permease subunit
MSQPPPGWHPDPNLSPEPQSVEGVAGPAGAASRFAAYDAPAAATGLNQFASATDPAFDAAGWRTLTQRNSSTFTAIFVVALYLVLAATTGIVLIGIFPAMLAFRAFQRREPLAALAVAAAAVAIVFSMTVLTRH